MRFPETACTKLRLFENMLSIRVLEVDVILVGRLLKSILNVTIQFLFKSDPDHVK